MVINKHGLLELCGFTFTLITLMLLGVIHFVVGFVMVFCHLYRFYMIVSIFSSKLISVFTAYLSKGILDEMHDEERPTKH